MVAHWQPHQHLRNKHNRSAYTECPVSQLCDDFKICLHPLFLQAWQHLIKSSFSRQSWARKTVKHIHFIFPLHPTSMSFSRKPCTTSVAQWCIYLVAKQLSKALDYNGAGSVRWLLLSVDHASIWHRCATFSFTPTSPVGGGGGIPKTCKQLHQASTNRSWIVRQALVEHWKANCYWHTVF